MAEDSWIRSLLKGTTALNGVSFTGASGVRWGRVAAGIVGAIVVVFSEGVIALVDTFFDGYAGVYDGLANFIGGPIIVDAGSPTDITSVETLPGFIDVVAGVPQAVLTGLTFDMAEYGILGYLVGVASILGAAWVLSQTISYLTGRYI